MGPMPFGRFIRPGLLVAVLLLVACDARTFVGGYPIADRMCPDPAAGWWCDGAADFAGASLDDEEPGHPAIVSVDAFQTDWRASNGDRVLRTYGTSGGDGIVVLGLADDTVRAVYVGCISGPTPAGVQCSLASQMPGEH